MNGLSLDTAFHGGPVPPWLRRFEAEPVAALHELLLGRAALGHLAPEEPSELLLDWLQFVGEQTDFAGRLDRALSEWIDRSWGTAIFPDGARSASITALAWCRAADVIAESPALVIAAKHLRSKFLSDRPYLAALVEGRARDPAGRAWRALARHQNDRSLLEHWWRLCNVAPDEPWYRGNYGIDGFRGLPLPAGTGHGFSIEVAQGLMRFALGLHRRLDDGWIAEDLARDEFLRTARLTMRAYPMEDRWESFWRHIVENMHYEPIHAWVQRLTHGATKTPEYGASVKRRGSWPQPPPNWKDEAQKIDLALSRHESNALAEAKKLLKRQQEHADRTGDAEFVVHSACRFATTLRALDPEQALNWAELAREYDRWDAHAWTATVECLVVLDRHEEALRVALESVRRFPQDTASRNTLAEILKARGNVAEAEAILRETIEQFPDDPFAWTALATLLREGARLDEAETIYRNSMRRFKTNVYARNGLAAVLKEQGRLEEAKAVYLETLEKFPDNDIARRGLETLHKQAKKKSHPQLEAPDRPVIPFRADDLETLLTDVHVLRRWGRQIRATAATPGDLRTKAREALGKWIDHDARAAGELGLLRLSEGELAAARDLLRHAATQFPGSARVQYALARAERALAAADHRRLDERQPEIVIRPWRRLGHLDERYKPIDALGRGRAWLALIDGATVEKEARAAFGQLGDWIYRQLDQKAPGIDKDPFETWWAQQMRARIFDGVAVRGYHDVPSAPALSERLAPQAVTLDALEEDWVQRIATA